MNDIIERFESRYKLLKKLDAKLNLNGFIKKNLKGLAVACVLCRVDNKYQYLYKQSLNNVSLDWAGYYAIFLINSKIYNVKDIDYIIELANQSIFNLYNY